MVNKHIKIMEKPKLLVLEKKITAGKTAKESFYEEKDFISGFDCANDDRRTDFYWMSYWM